MHGGSRRGSHPQAKTGRARDGQSRAGQGKPGGQGQAAGLKVAAPTPAAGERSRGLPSTAPRPTPTG